MRLLSFPTIAILCFHISTYDALSQETTLTAGPFHPSCPAAYARLPLDKFGYPIETATGGAFQNSMSFEDSILKYKEEYIEYDRACFKPYKNLRDFTKQFVSASLGALFTENPNFLCAAFRIASDKVATAGHCATEIEMSSAKSFRLVGHPATEISVLNRLPPFHQEPLSDFIDFAIFRTEEPSIPGFWVADDFSQKKIQPHQVIGILGLSLVPHLLLPPRDPDRWVEQVRFSRVFSSKVWPVEEVVTAEASLVDRSDCIYHRAPTFAGMSGAPIIAVLVGQDGAQPKLAVVGLHLRNGSERSEDCGEAPGYNVGIKIPRAILEIID